MLSDAEIERYAEKVIDRRVGGRWVLWELPVRLTAMEVDRQKLGDDWTIERAREIIADELEALRIMFDRRGWDWPEAHA